MSPRSEEFQAQARERTTAAQELLESGHLESAVSEAITPEQDEAQRIVEGASKFVAAVERMLAA